MASPTEITYETLKQHSGKENLYLLVHNKVYDVSKFIDEHPGGDEVMLAEAGKDATEAFEDVGHSDEAREILQKLYIGEFEKNSELKTKGSPVKVSAADHQQNTGGAITYFVPIALLGAYFAWRYYSS
ncbi:hypothetical protein M422DRAFT_27942 [Sphaerobolus stellatus SS14]|nr:hypothetical protein M422DRAFT_27942 [Sphaerobolus stellatus SS14]